MNEHKLLAREEFFCNLFVESTSEEQNRDDQQNSWDEFIRSVEGLHVKETSSVLDAYVEKREACPSCYLNKEVRVGCIYDPLNLFLVLLDVHLSMVN